MDANGSMNTYGFHLEPDHDDYGREPVRRRCQVECPADRHRLEAKQQPGRHPAIRADQ